MAVSAAVSGLLPWRRVFAWIEFAPIAVSATDYGDPPGGGQGASGRAAQPPASDPVHTPPRLQDAADSFVGAMLLDAERLAAATEADAVIVGALPGSLRREGPLKRRMMQRC